MRMTTSRNRSRRGHDQHEHVRIADRLVEADAGRDQAGARRAERDGRGQPRPRVQRGLFERAHGRMQRGRTPEEVVGDPADVVGELVVVGVREQRKRVGRVDREQRDDARRRGGRRPALACPCRPQDARRRQAGGCRRAGRRPRPTFSGSVRPERWMFGATRKTHESRLIPTVRISESITPARSPCGFRRLTRRSSPATSAG